MINPTLLELSIFVTLATALLDFRVTFGYYAHLCIQRSGKSSEYNNNAQRMSVNSDDLSAVTDMRSSLYLFVSICKRTRRLKLINSPENPSIVDVVEPVNGSDILACPGNAKACRVLREWILVDRKHVGPTLSMLVISRCRCLPCELAFC